MSNTQKTSEMVALDKVGYALLDEPDSVATDTKIEQAKPADAKIEQAKPADAKIEPQFEPRSCYQIKFISDRKQRMELIFTDLPTRFYSNLHFELMKTDALNHAYEQCKKHSTLPGYTAWMVRFDNHEDIMSMDALEKLRIVVNAVGSFFFQSIYGLASNPDYLKCIKRLMYAATHITFTQTHDLESLKKTYENFGGRFASFEEFSKKLNESPNGILTVTLNY